MMRTTCACIGYGTIAESDVERAKTIAEAISGQAPRRMRVRTTVLEGAQRSPNAAWIEEELAVSSDGGEGDDADRAASGSGRDEFVLCSSGRMRSTLQVKGNCGRLKSLSEVRCRTATREAFLEDVGLSPTHVYIKDGWEVTLVDRSEDALMSDEGQQGGFRVVLRIVQLNACEEMEGEIEEAPEFPGHWLVDLTAKASGADYSHAVGAFEDFASKLSHVVKFTAPK